MGPHSQTAPLAPEFKNSPNTLHGALIIIVGIIPSVLGLLDGLRYISA